MSQRNEIEAFHAAWESEARSTTRLLEALPQGQYDFRPDPSGRSLGEVAWHLAEVEAYPSLWVAQRKVSFEPRPPGLERPKDIASLATGYRRIHQEAEARIQGLDEATLDE